MKILLSLLIVVSLLFMVGCQDQSKVQVDLKSEAAKETERSQKGGGGGRPMPTDGIDN